MVESPLDPELEYLVAVGDGPARRACLVWSKGEADGQILGLRFRLLGFLNSGFVDRGPSDWFQFQRGNRSRVRLWLGRFLRLLFGRLNWFWLIDFDNRRWLDFRFRIAKLCSRTHFPDESSDLTL